MELLLFNQLPISIENNKPPSHQETKISNIGGMARLHEDLLAEILSWLPVKTLMRFKCVSKGWYSLISNPTFAKLHLNRGAKTEYSSCQKIILTTPIQSVDYEAFDRDDGKDGKEAVQLLSFPSYDTELNWGTLIGSCDGLICLERDGDFILCNPCTGKSRKFHKSGLVPNEETAYFFWGFGYDSVSDDYKILYGAEFSDASKESTAVVFSLKSNSWRRIDHKYVGNKAYYEGGVYFNGALHWCVSRKNGPESDFILSFDLADEKFKNVLPTPEADDGGQGLGTQEGHLFVYTYDSEDRLQAWIMKDYGNGNSWIKWLDVDGLPWFEYYIRLIACTESGKIVCQMDEREMILFNPEDHTYKNIPVDLNDGYAPMTTYIESLVCVFPLP